MPNSIPVRDPSAPYSSVAAPVGSSSSADPSPAALQAERARIAIGNTCKREGNRQGLYSSTLSVGALGVAHYVLDRTSQLYRNRIELTGKILAASVVVYSAFYLRSFQATRQCVEREGVRVRAEAPIVVSQVPGDNIKAIQQARPVEIMSKLQDNKSKKI